MRTLVINCLWNPSTECYVKIANDELKYIELRFRERKINKKLELNNTNISENSGRKTEIRYYKVVDK